ncbi:hypothetical protein [Acinetobacter pittii]|uniref:hypothetical protein n=1 Tax=Acinetobacter pittii TaxID=48296 RepID=UPI0023413401|nr:hypothetical protein [Acinetobacter pittii]MDC4735092.1 hypothetical protein [Acinetobacter baumannii]MDI7713516.1 hypothetical protein [Acinetobacter baumannii]WGM26205.1 hypothetical protein OFU58_07935 [Acinetobacter pittii]
MNKYLEKPAVQYFFLIAISILYFFGICHFFNIDLAKLRALDPNALGDFLAGSFAPLGFILLILGYTQNTQALKFQGEELKASTEALKLQVIEMKESVDQQRIMAELQKVELEDRHNAVIPVIAMDCTVHVLNGKINFRLGFTNHSENPARHIVIEYYFNEPKTFEIFPKDHYQEIIAPFTSDEDHLFRDNKEVVREIGIQFENIFGRKYENKYKISTYLENRKPHTDIKKIL